MSDLSAGTVIDCLEFARNGGVLERRIGFGELPRLADILVTADGCLTARLEGRLDEDGKSWLLLDVEGSPMLRCQRCLAEIAFPLEIHSNLQLIAPGEEWPDDDLQDDSADSIPAEKSLLLLSLIEDEVLLALPIAPRHEQCESPSAYAVGQGSSPFAALAALNKH